MTGNHPIKVTDVHEGRNKQKIQIVLRSSKTHTTANLPQIIKIESNSRKVQKNLIKLLDDNCHCPYKIVAEYRDAWGGYDSINEEFFVFSNGSPVKPAQVRAVLRKTLEIIGLVSAYYDTHSFCIG